MTRTQANTVYLGDNIMSPDNIFCTVTHMYYTLDDRDKSIVLATLTPVDNSESPKEDVNLELCSFPKNQGVTS